MPPRPESKRFMSQTVTVIMLALALLTAPQEGIAEEETPVIGWHGMKFNPWVDFSFLMGTAHETVYQPTNYSHPNIPGGHKNSELIWEIENMFLIGTGLSVDLFSWAFINFSGWAKMTDGNGQLDDYDWIAEVNNVVRTYAEWSHWSHHDETDVTRGMILDINVAFTPPFLKAGPVSFGIVNGYKRDSFAWKAYGGSFIYTVDSFRDIEGDFPKNELGISYKQTFDMPYFGLCALADFNAFDLKARLIYSPWVRGDAVDHHHLRNLATYEKFSNGQMIAFDIAGAYHFTHFFALEAGFAYTRYDPMKGDTRWIQGRIGNEPAYSINLEDSAGTALETFLFSLRFSFYF